MGQRRRTSVPARRGLGIALLSLVTLPMTAWAVELPAPEDTPEAEPTVTVVPGPTSEVDVLRPCDDVVHLVEEATSFVLERADGAADDLEVALTSSGTSVPGQDHEPLPATVTFPAGATEVTVPVTPLEGPEERLVDLTLEITEGDGYAPGEPAAATIEFVAPKDPDAPPPECGLWVEGGPEIVRRIEVGERPQPLVVMGFFPPTELQLAPEDYRMRILTGELPAGLQLRADGVFTGTATAPGTSVATTETCRTEPPGTCITTELTVVVTASEGDGTDAATTSRPELPATGPPLVLAVLGVLLLGGGTTVVRVSRRAARTG